MKHNIRLSRPIKNLLIIGDSYSTYEGYIPEGYGPYYTKQGGTDLTSVEQTWWHRYVSENGINLVRNDSWSGATVCYTGRVSPEWGYNTSFVNRMHKMMDEDFFNKENIDTVFIFGATNDSWLETTPKGEVIFEGWREEDLYSTLPAIAYMIAKLKEAIPGGNIVFIINTELEDCITKGVKEASEHFGTSYIELSDIDKSEGHPTVLGMMQIADQIREAVKN